MTITMLVQLWPTPGGEQALHRYEDEVLAMLHEYGDVVARVRPLEPDGGPVETHVLSFPDEAALERYMADPRRLALSAERDRAVARTEIVRVEPLP